MIELDYVFQNGCIYVTRSGLYNPVDGTVNPWMILSHEEAQIHELINDTVRVPSGLPQFLRKEVAARFADDPNLAELVISRSREDGSIQYQGVDSVDAGL
jgi:hypothetical protein